MTPYPPDFPSRDRWIVARRPPRNQVDPRRAYARLLEKELNANGEIVDGATIFLTGSECPWKCVMCDLWRNTTERRTSPGAIPKQIERALKELHNEAPHRIPRQIKLYNSGSFFDRNAVPVEDYETIARQVARFERVIVECHPSLIGDRTIRFRDLLAVQNHDVTLEVAMGLETANPAVLEKLNKRFSVDDFAASAERLRREGMALRVFLLVRPPFVDKSEDLKWVRRSLAFAFDCGATVVSLIPTRPGNGALEVLAQFGQFSLPRLSELEVALDAGINLGRGRVFADLWDLATFSRCPDCLSARRDRLEQMNLQQRVLDRVACASCA